MNQTAGASFAPLETGDARSAAPHVSSGSAAEPVQNGLVRLSGLSDEAREAAIQQAGRLVERHMADRRKYLLYYDISNNLADKGAADRSRLMAEEAARLMAALIKGRSPQQVERMKAAQQERMALEPGAPQ